MAETSIKDPILACFCAALHEIYGAQIERWPSKAYEFKSAADYFTGGTVGLSDQEAVEAMKTAKLFIAHFTSLIWGGYMTINSARPISYRIWKLKPKASTDPARIGFQLWLRLCSKQHRPYHENDATLENAQIMAAHESRARTFTTAPGMKTPSMKPKKSLFI